jgi:hypothetical protein
MKSNSWQIVAPVILSCLGALTAGARPIEFSEVSLLVRSHESSPEILDQVRSRKLLYPLTSQQEDVLKHQGANDDLIRGLRDSRVALSTAEANAFGVEEQRVAAHRHETRETHNESVSVPDNVRVFDVSYDHPINLSQWGGPDYDVIFKCRRYAGEDVIEPFLTDNVRSYVDTATYLGHGRDDSTTMFDHRNYSSVVAREVSRPISIDTANPVFLKDVPYTLYHVCGAQGISLYYIGKNGGSVKLAVVASRL